MEGHQDGGRPCGMVCHLSLLSSVLLQSYPSHEVLVPSHSSRLRCAAEKEGQEHAEAMGVNCGFSQTITVDKPVSERQWGSQGTSGYVWVHPGTLAPQLGCERFESSILVKVVSVRLHAANTILFAQRKCLVNTWRMNE